ncbi:cob(I)yrinic acid a,c-diamide adenosyltransferase [Candidatus Woesearchaeota archaeon]|nr:cob(I)yrinic acid a,c-diamide adenosyltransferase [Candidatus Woesearchaeota archaeon]
MARYGKIQVYTGDGKGKTTASLGLALRTVGQGGKVFIVQFMKGGAYTGEFISIKNFLPKIDIIQFGRGCVKEKKQMKLLGINEGAKYFDFVREDIECGPCRYCFLNDQEQVKFVKSAFALAQKLTASEDYDLIILDEVNVALKLGFLSIEEVLELMEKKHPQLELIMTGRDAHEKVMEKADLVTEMKLVKHYFDKGTSARRGIEY